MNWLVTLGLKLAKTQGWAEPVPPACPLRHYTLEDENKVNALLHERTPGPCTRQHCDGRHWGDADQAYVDALLAQINDARYQLESERLKASPLPEVPAEVLMRAKEFGDAAEYAFPAGFGEAKRHDVFGKLLKAYPGLSQRLLGLAIELTLPEKRS